MTTDDALTSLDERHRFHDGSIPPPARTRPLSSSEARTVVAAHEAACFRETLRAIVARRARLTAFRAPGDAWIKRLERAAAFHRDRALQTLRTGP